MIDEPRDLVGVMAAVAGIYILLIVANHLFD